jgi:GAF domain-containing protein
VDIWPPEQFVNPAASWCAKPTVPLLDLILETAEQLVPGTHLEICAASTETYRTLAGTQPLASMLDQLQFDLGEGPTLTAMREGHTVIVDDAESEHRWPAFMSRAAGLGLRSYLGLPITDDRGRTLGGLSMYSTTRTAVDVTRLAHARLFAGQAAMALTQAKRVTDLLAALQSSRTIGKAIGLVMERFDIDDHDAFAHLAELSQTSNVQLRDIAAHMVTQANKLRRSSAAEAPLQEPASSGLSLVSPLDAPVQREPETTTALRLITTSTPHDDIVVSPADL